MFRLMKYEIRKNITGVIVLFSIIMGLEAYFLFSAFTENREHTAISTVLLVMATMVSFFCVFIFGVSTYSKELKSKTGYMTFMTPISAFTVIGSKFLSILIEGIFFAVLLGLLACADMALFEGVFPETKLFTEFMDMLFKNAGVDAARFWTDVFLEVIEILVEFFAIVSMAYLAITLSSTAFQNKKYKGVISAVIFVIIVVIVSKIADKIPAINEATGRMMGGVVSIIPALIYFTVITVISILVSAKLLEKRVSL